MRYGSLMRNTELKADIICTCDVCCNAFNTAVVTDRDYF